MQIIILFVPIQNFYNFYDATYGSYFFKNTENGSHFTSSNPYLCLCEWTLPHLIIFIFHYRRRKARTIDYFIQGFFFALCESEDRLIVPIQSFIQYKEVKLGHL